MTGIADLYFEGVAVLLQIIQNIGKRFTSLKGKLLFLFILVVLVMGSLSVYAYLSMKAVVAQLNTMAEATISANDIKTQSLEVPKLLSAYFIYKTEENRVAVGKKISQIKVQIDHLQKYVRDEEGVSSIASLTGLMSSFEEATHKTIAILQSNQLGEKFLAQNDEVKKIGGFLSNEIQNLITIELNHYQKLKTDLDRTAAMTGLMVLALIIIVGVLTVVGTVIYLNKVIGALTQVAGSARNIASGNLQIAALQVGSRDEIALLADSFNQMGRNLRELIGRIIASSTQVADAAEFLKKSAEQSSQASDQIAAAIQQVSHGASEQAAESQKTVTVITELLADNQKVFERAMQVLSAAEKAAQTAQNGNENVNRLMSQIEVIEQEILAAQTRSEVLKQRSEEIGEILSLINSMAEQSNLLSLNASIEAARAGEYGKGFAVVANEVRKLADGSAQAVGSISALLQEIRLETTQVAEQMARGVAKVKNGTEIAQETRSAFAQIVNTSQETDQGVKTITAEIQKMIRELKKVGEMSETIAVISQESSAGSQEVAATTQEQNASLEEITGAAATLSNMAAELQNVAQRFQL